MHTRWEYKTSNFSEQRDQQCWCVACPVWHCLPLHPTSRRRYSMIFPVPKKKKNKHLLDRCNFFSIVIEDFFSERLHLGPLELVLGGSENSSWKELEADVAWVTSVGHHLIKKSFSTKLWPQFSQHDHDLIEYRLIYAELCLPVSGSRHGRGTDALCNV